MRGAFSEFSSRAKEPPPSERLAELTERERVVMAYEHGLVRPGWAD